jgi:hypothetical protein
MRRAGFVARMKEMKKVYRILLGKRKGRDHLQDLGVDRIIILKWIVMK